MLNQSRLRVPVWTRPDENCRNLLLSSTFYRIGAVQVSGAAIILKSARHELEDKTAKHWNSRR